jgi:Xaa-Pro aminopeptidase
LQNAAQYAESRSRDMNPHAASLIPNNSGPIQSVEGLWALFQLQLLKPSLTNRIYKDVLQSIQRDWDFMTGAECIPVHVALSLMDTSTLGKAEREPDFLNMYNEIQRTLKSIVNGWDFSPPIRFTSTDETCLRAPSGIQQFHWYIPHDPV